MLTLLKVRERVAVPTHATIELAPTAERAAGEAEPEIFLEIAFRAMRQPFAHRISLSCRNREKKLRTHRTWECGPWRAGEA